MGSDAHLEAKCCSGMFGRAHCVELTSWLDDWHFSDAAMIGATLVFFDRSDDLG